MMETMIPPQVGMRLRTLWKIKEAKEAQIKKEAEKANKKEAKEPNQKKEEKERRGNATILLPHLCASK